MKNTINEDRKWTVLSHYEYLPDGSKLSALAGSGAGYKYRGSFVYSVDSSGNEKLESVACDEGRISVTYSGSGAASYRDDWHVRDYLGNTRLVVNITSASTPPSTGILEKSDYLPFGTRVATSSTPLNRWRQSGKEEQVIGGNDLGVLDFGARHYDPWLARWTTQDPMAGKYTNLSPYSYCAENPVNIVDLDGMALDDYSVSRNGYISLIRKTEDDFDRLFISYSEYGPNIQNHLTIKDRELLSSLEKTYSLDSASNEEFSSVKSTNKKELFALFKFLADNTDVEWVIHKGGNDYSLGTKHSKDNAGSWDNYILFYPESSIHSHPNIKPSIEDEVYSMGFRSAIPGDQNHIETEYSTYGLHTRQRLVYFPESKRVYKLKPYHVPRYIKTVSNSNQLCNVRF